MKGRKEEKERTGQGRERKGRKKTADWLAIMSLYFATGPALVPTDDWEPLTHRSFRQANI